MSADDSLAKTQAALATLTQLRAAMKPGDPLSLLKAGFWAETMHEIGIAPDTDGPELIMNALALRPNDPEYAIFAALAHMQKHPALFRKQWDRARALSTSGSAAARNLRTIETIYSGIYPELFR